MAIRDGQTLAQLLKRPEVTIEQLAPILQQQAPEFFERDSAPAVVLWVEASSEVRNELKSVETEIKYEGYLLQQQRAMDRLKKSEQHSIPEWFDYRSVSGLSREMQEKLTKVRPRTIGQASRIPGVTPAAVSLVNVFIEIQARRRGSGDRHLEIALSGHSLLKIVLRVQLLRSLHFGICCLFVPHVAIRLPQQVVSRRIVRIHRDRVLQSQNRQIVVALFLEHLTHQDERHARRRIEPDRALQKPLRVVEFLHPRVGIGQFVVGRSMRRIDGQLLLKFRNRFWKARLVEIEFS